MQVIKILTASQWESFQDTGVFTGAPVDIADGFIHLSTARQLEGTLAKHFAGQTGCVFAAIDADAVADHLRWELAPSRGEEFPHLYRELRMTDVLWSRPVDE